MSNGEEQWMWHVYKRLSGRGKTSEEKKFKFRYLELANSRNDVGFMLSTDLKRSCIHLPD